MVVKPASTAWRLICVLTGALWFSSAALAQLATDNDAIISESAELQLNVSDYQREFRAKTISEHRALRESDDVLREFVLDFHSNERLSQLAEQSGLTQDPDVQAVLEQIRRRTLAVFLLNKASQDAQIPDDLSALAYQRYKATPKAFRTKERRRVAHILLTDEQKNAQCVCEDEQVTEEQPTAEERAEQLRTRLLDGEDFAALAREYSQDPGSAARGGELPKWLQRNGQTVKQFEDAAFDQLEQVGDITQPVKSPFGMHLIKLLDLVPSERMDFADVQPAIEQQLRSEIRASAQNALRSASYPDPSTVNYPVLLQALRDYQQQQGMLPAQSEAEQADTTADDASPSSP